MHGCPHLCKLCSSKVPHFKGCLLERLCGFCIAPYSWQGVYGVGESDTSVEGGDRFAVWMLFLICARLVRSIDRFLGFLQCSRMDTVFCVL